MEPKPHSHSLRPSHSARAASSPLTASSPRALSRCRRALVFLWAGTAQPRLWLVCCPWRGAGRAHPTPRARAGMRNDTAAKLAAATFAAGLVCGLMLSRTLRRYLGKLSKEL